MAGSTFQTKRICRTPFQSNAELLTAAELSEWPKMDPGIAGMTVDKIRDDRRQAER
jgi:hypothetical protein